ncbi:uncharacterized protein LOC106092057 isoform X1 [Stomoxys calcitrans]|uniref:uncharacterized protein LOC106092057 isoform X1 n=1 Tax=Stomoxys calcitrans TaxID=35570 RepID=UPI0027E2B362|nr:uncharacterized protein LOC106092057 isoform X1 [Stomoxys calcitrans]XP_059217950.1 uncharacterized protein LOC106092057 isoform X1 [Stomoxys calcitrans]
MLSSIASYLFGSNTTTTTPDKETLTATGIGSGVEEIIDAPPSNTVDVDNLIEVTSLTPSVTGSESLDKSSAVAAATARAIRRGKNKRNNTRQQNKRKAGVKGGNTKETGSTSGKQITKLSTTSSPSDSCDEDFDEDEWFIVEKEDDDNDVSSPRNENEADNNSTTTTIEIVKSVKPTIAPSPLAQQRRLQHINSHSLYSGPRPQKQRNYLQKSRGNNNNSSRNSGLSVSTLSPSRTVNENRNAPLGNGPSGVTADGGMTRSLYVVSSSASAHQDVAANGSLGNLKKMDESWFVTPPPCFTSIGPINMEATPYENLLIEHPSMSVYHSIKTAQAATESFVKLDLGIKEPKEKRPAKENVQRKNSQAVQQRSSAGFRLDRQSVAQLKQELLERTVQKTQTKKDRRDICRSAIKRANKVRDVQSKNHTSRRSDRQHFKVVSSANNNRKSCF